MAEGASLVALGTSYLRLALAAVPSGDAPRSGVLGMLIRVQLATPNAAFLDPEDLQTGLHHARIDDVVPVLLTSHGDNRQAEDRQYRTYGKRPFQLVHFSPPFAIEGDR